VAKKTTRSTGEIVAEQEAIDALGDVHKRLAVEWVVSQKQFMKSISDLSYTKWRKAILKQAKIDLSTVTTKMTNDIIEASYEINKADSIPAKKLTKKKSLSIAANTKITGNTTKENLNKLANLAYGTILSQTTRYAAQGLNNIQITDAIMGSESQLYKNGDLIRYINGARTHSITNTKAGTEANRNERYDDDASVIGYVWDSILDGHTSTTCLGLNGKTFYYTRNGVTLSGYKPLPPIHPNCRSSTQPIYDRKNVPKVQPFKEWADQWIKEGVPDEGNELLEALGRTRFDLFKRGELSIQRFTDARFKPLNIPQLARQLTDKGEISTVNGTATLLVNGKPVTLDEFLRNYSK